MSKRSFWTTPISQLKPVQIGPAFATLTLGGFPFGVVLGILLIDTLHYSASDLATQVAEGTHEIKWDTNEFGTREVRIVEKTND